MSAATDPVAIFYRRTLIDLDKARAELVNVGAAVAVITALDNYRAAVQEALHAQGVSR